VLTTRIASNGTPGEMEVRWPLLLKLLFGAIPILLAAAVIGQFRANVQIAVLSERLTNFVQMADKEHRAHDSMVPRNEHEVLQKQHDREIDELRRRVTALEAKTR